jgi:hypothetical protein
MTKPTDTAGVNDDNYISVDRNKLKEDQEKELREAMKK